MVKQLAITQDKFDKLLAWLDADRERAGKRYEEIRQSLIKILTWRGCVEAEDMADEVINRVARKLPELEYTGDPALYFYGVAKKVLLEHKARERLHLQLTETQGHELISTQDQENDLELIHECLNRCLQEISPKNRETITAYYLRDKQAKIDNRKVMAQQMGVGLSALRVRTYRIRTILEQCIKRCLAHSN